jgi:hypothetical protein
MESILEIILKYQRIYFFKYHLKVININDKNQSKIMASMGYTDDTLSSVMNLIDENKEKFTEETYVHMCNFLKIVHTNIKGQRTGTPLMVPFGIETPEKLTLDFKYKHYVCTTGKVRPDDKLNVLNTLFKRSNSYYTTDYEIQSKRYLTMEQLNILYKQERQKRCKNDSEYKDIKSSYVQLLGESAVILCFD